MDKGGALVENFNVANCPYLTRTTSHIVGLGTTMDNSLTWGGCPKTVTLCDLSKSFFSEKILFDLSY